MTSISIFDLVDLVALSKMLDIVNFIRGLLK